MDVKVKALAKKYYPTYWDKKKIANLVRAGKLTRKDYKEITGLSYPEAEQEV